MTAAIAEAAGQLVLRGRILATTQASQPDLPDPADPAWRASLPKTAGPAMRRDLETRLGDQAAEAVDLLRPLAYAQGSGLPWEDIWALLANALAPGHGYTNEDLLWLVGHAGSYIVEGGTIEDRSVYRLYHRSLAEDLLGGRDQAADQHAITAALAAHVPRRHNGRPDWPASHPYTGPTWPPTPLRPATSTTSHKTLASCSPPTRPHCSPRSTRTTSTPARAAADAYRSALPLLRRHPPLSTPPTSDWPHAAGGPTALADRLDADGLDRPLAGAMGILAAATRPPAAHRASDWVTAVAAAELDGRPVIISGSGDGTVRVWDLATGTPIGEPAHRPRRACNAVAVGELDGRPVIISGGDDGTVRVWDLATGGPVGSPLTGHS